MYIIIALKQIPLTRHALLRQIKRLIRPKINIYELHIHRNSFHLFRMIALKSLSVRAKILEWLSICDEKQKPRRLICPCFDGKHNLPSTLPFLLVLAVWVQMFFFFSFYHFLRYRGILERQNLKICLVNGTYWALCLH